MNLRGIANELTMRLEHIVRIHSAHKVGNWAVAIQCLKCTVFLVDISIDPKSILIAISTKNKFARTNEREGLCKQSKILGLLSCLLQMLNHFKFESRFSILVRLTCQTNVLKREGQRTKPKRNEKKREQ